MTTYEFLQQLPYFSELTDKELRRLCTRTEEVPIPSGTTLFEKGSESDAMYVIADGAFEVTDVTREREVVIGHLGVGDVLGEISLLEERPHMASARAIADSRVVKVPGEEFHRLLGNPALLLGMVRTLTSRLRGTEAMLHHEERMAGLGRLAAGLMHELNNPSAAIGRSAARLGETISAWQEAEAGLAELGVERSPLLLEQRTGPTDPVERADRTGEVERWAEDQGIEEPWALAPELVAGGWDTEGLQQIMAGLDAEQTRAVAKWLALRGAAADLLHELRVGADRISELVRVVKGYSYLDQAPVQRVDIGTGLEDTLTVLGHKIGPKIRIARDYEAGLGAIEAYGAELNQVWTNLIDNALGAMGDEGELTVRARTDGDDVVVEIADTGPGIPEEVQASIFDPFYTTKPLGEGTGLGLHTTHTIVAKHGGEITLTSRPGETVFRVRLSRRLPAQETGDNH